MNLNTSLLSDKSDGVLFEPKPDNLARALEDLLSKGREMKKMAHRLPKNAEQLSLESFRDRLVGILSSWTAGTMGALLAFVERPLP